ncbi:DUF4398 domain-containing protein [Dokdonella sp.]|uniref:DUF4398 domain-containing protein n=1 Tax=Dokdonella sp. TaxID=2291710 RepID=UPI002F413662
MKMIRIAVTVALAAAAGVVHAIDRDAAQRELAQAATAVQAAERDDAARYAPGDLGEAHAALDAAQRAADAREWTDAAYFAERAKVNGDLASARARQQRAEAATARIQRSIDTLQAEGGVP